jgi:small subunit ribosomal protein S8
MDTIANMLTKIRNAQLVGHKEVEIQTSKLKAALADILEKEGFVEKAVREKVDDTDSIKVVLKYYADSGTKKTPAIKGIRKISRPGQRIYVKNKDIKSVKNKFGIAIISTSRGLMTDYEARKEGMGGEYICEVW